MDGHPSSIFIDAPPSSSSGVNSASFISCSKAISPREMGVMYKSDIKWALLTSCVHPAYSRNCLANTRLEVLQLGVWCPPPNAVELELRPISDSVRLHMAILLTRFSWCRAYTNCFSTRAWSSAIFCFMTGIESSRCLTSALFFVAEILCCCWRSSVIIYFFLLYFFFGVFTGPFFVSFLS